MSHELFEEVVKPTVTVGSRSPYSVAASIAVHVLIIGAVVIAPLMAVDVLPAPTRSLPDYVLVVSPPVPPASTPAPARDAEARANAEAPAEPATAPDVPTEAPDGIRDREPPAPPAMSVGHVVSDRLLDSLGPGGPGTRTPSPPPPQVPSGPVRIGGQIREPVKVVHVPPVYPAIAQNARIHGTVTIEAVIGTDGAVREATVRSGVPLLDQAALDAVRRWRYRPTLLNGVAVPVIMTVQVRFTLGS